MTVISTKKNLSMNCQIGLIGKDNTTTTTTGHNTFSTSPIYQVNVDFCENNVVHTL